MSWVRMNIKNEQVSGELEMDQLGSNETQAVITGFFETFGLAGVERRFKKDAPGMVPPPSPIKTAGDPLLPNMPKATFSSQTTHEFPAELLSGTINSKQAVKEIIKDAAKEAIKRIEKPAMLNSDRTLTTPLGEALEEAIRGKGADVSKQVPSTEQSEYWKVTGIRYKSGMAHYRCRYWCKNPDCRGKGNHYILPDEKTVDCHDCGSVHEIREAVPGKPLQRDIWGNFFIADFLA